MRPVPKLPDHRVNVSPIHPLREAFFLIAGICLIGGLIFGILAFSVDLLVPFISSKMETKMLAPIWEQVEDQMRVEATARAKEIAQLLNRLSSHWQGHPYDFRVGIWDEESSNAFALPGGAILVTSGLINEAESENELAFVLGHELGHFHHRDHLRALGRSILFNLVLNVIGKGGGEAISLLGTTRLLTERHFSRDQERAADRFGLELLYKEYGHVAGGTDFLKKLALRDNTRRSFSEFTETHPVSEERIDHLQGFAFEKGWVLEGDLRLPIGKSDST